MNARTFVLIVLGCAPAAGFGQTLFEDFDAAGHSWSETVFPELVISGSATFTREALGPGMGVPNTTPPLPINQNGDQEGRYSGQGGGTGSFAFTENVPHSIFQSGKIEGFIAFGVGGGAEGRNISFLLKGSADGGGVNAYAATMTFGTFTGFFSIHRVRDGVFESLVRSTRFAVDLENENYRIVFTTTSRLVTAALWRVRVENGHVVRLPVDLSSEGGVQNTIEVVDHELREGRAGLHASLGGLGSAFFEDIEVVPCLCPSDLDNDCDTDLADLGILLADFGCHGGACVGDINGDGQTGLEDLGILLSLFGQPCP